MSSEIPVKQIDPSSDTSDNNKNTGTVELYASRKKIYVKGVKKGFFQRIRNVSLTALMGMYFLFVWFTVDGQPLIHFDRRFWSVFYHHAVRPGVVWLHMPPNRLDIYLHVGGGAYRGQPQ